jgi:hypothetical protein
MPLRAGAALLLLGLAATACDRNTATPILIPTGIRSRPAVGTGSLVGRVVYDPQQAPDLVDPPYPPTVVELYESGAVVVRDTLESSTRDFAFRELPAGTYSVVARPRLFKPSSLPPIRVVADEVDVGDLIAPIDFTQFRVAIHLYGDFNGYADLQDSLQLVALRTGVWWGPDQPEYPQGPSPDTAITLASGTYSIRFVTNYYLGNPYYGGDGVTVVDAPVTGVPLRYTSDPMGDLRVRIPTTGRYRFYLDERRLTMTIEQLPASAALAARRTRR